MKQNDSLSKRTKNEAPTNHLNEQKNDDGTIEVDDAAAATSQIQQQPTLVYFAAASGIDDDTLADTVKFKNDSKIILT